ncbi:MAG: 50S ribosomal protein L17 [Deltaproteobacteria bacterium]|nr:50S ribosomal protein L17 [Deltaproteobacteria bacterium]
MRHQVDKRKFGRTASHRRAMLRNMATSLLLTERCKTTVEKAKDLRRVTEKLITLGKSGTLHARRQALSYILNKKAVEKLFDDIAPRFKNRNGGYLRIVRANFRHGDAAEMAFIEFVEGPKKGASAKEAPAENKAAPKTSAAKSKKAAPAKAKAPKKAAKSKKEE